MIFQEPMNSFSPVHTVGSQIIEALRLHSDVSQKEARNRAVEMLAKVGIPQPEHRIDVYPHRTVRRHAPARHDRHGPGVQSEDPYRG